MRSHEKLARSYQTAEHKKDALAEGLDDEIIFEKAEKVLTANRIDPREFIGLGNGYSQADITKDLEYVERTEKEIAAEDTSETIEARKQAMVFEAILTDQIENQNWAGENTFVAKTSSYDDLNGVDAVLEVAPPQEEVTHAGLAIDATFGNDVAAKIRGLLRNIDEGVLAHVKYFKSPATDAKGPLKNLPNVVIAASIETVRDLAKTWILAYGKDIGHDEAVELKENLRTHHIQFQILEQITAQLHAFEQYAGKRNKLEIAGMYREAYEVFNEIFEQKKQELEDSGERDTLHREIMAEVERINTRL